MVKRLSAALGVCAALVAPGCDSLLGISVHQLATEEADAGSGVTNVGAGADAGTGVINAGAGGDASVALGPPGCFTGTPTTDSEYFNQCTSAQYLAFDNCAHLKLCPDAGDAALPALIPPDSGSATTGGAPPTPPTVGCYDPVTRPQLIFMQGSTNFTPFIQSVAQLIIAQSGYGIVWQPTSSCGCVDGMFDNDPDSNLMTNPTSAGQSPAAFYGADGGATPCLLGNSPEAPDGGTSEVTDICVSDIFANVCPNGSTWIPGSTGAYPDVSETLGPVITIVFVMPLAAPLQAMSAEAAYEVFGMGGNDGMAKPWIYPYDMFIRSSDTGTNNIMSKAIDVPPTQWWGVVESSAPDMVTAITTQSSTEVNYTIGILSANYADTASTQNMGMRILYFQAIEQLAGFLPDSTPMALDKQNVRDGHYSPWGFEHLYTKTVSGVKSPEALAFIQPFNTPTASILDATITGGWVPVCAMRVTRTSEMGPLMPSSTTPTCNCYYDEKVNGVTSCATCTTSAECPNNQACSLGYCEDNPP